MTDYVLGLDWINPERGWSCCQLLIDPEATPTLDILPLSERESVLVREVVKVVLDAPP